MMGGRSHWASLHQVYLACKDEYTSISSNSILEWIVFFLKRAHYNRKCNILAPALNLQVKNSSRTQFICPPAAKKSVIIKPPYLGHKPVISMNMTHCVEGLPFFMVLHKCEVVLIGELAC